jgi:hypothetical protein
MAFSPVIVRSNILARTSGPVHDSEGREGGRRMALTNFECIQTSETINDILATTHIPESSIQTKAIPYNRGLNCIKMCHKRCRKEVVSENNLNGFV